MGNVLALLVLAGDISDQAAARLLLALYAAQYPELVQIWGDSHYGGEIAVHAATVYGITLEVVDKPTGQKGFVLLPRRWVVERTFGWLMRCRRLGRDYEREPAFSEAWIHIASIHRLLKQLAPDRSLPIPYQRKAA